jgi:CheY-like chemotaxis protein/two-component sensor histidine kinase
VIGLTDLLKRTSLDAEQRGYVEHLSSSGHTMMRLLNDLLELSRLRSATIQFEIDAIETAKLLEEIAEHVRFGVGVKPIAVTLDIAAGVPARFLGDEARVRQVLLNLAGNAAKFTAAGEITIHASRRMLDDRDMLAISLQDTGIGITADEFELIFEPFAQASAATHRLYGGTGLGLSIVTQLVSLMGGRILAESIPGKGSIFELVLPFSPVTAAPTAGENENEGEAMAATPPSPRRRGRVLVAEDNAVNQLVLGAMLDRLGVEAVMAGDGTEALARLEAEPSGFDLVLMDVEMPTLDGLRTTQRIRAAGLDAGLLPIIAVTANVLAETVAKCLESGMQACLAKPILIDDLDAILRTYLSAAPEHITTC